MLLSIVLAWDVLAQAEVLWGTIVDPQQRVVEGAFVSLICAEGTETRATDNEGRFSFTRQFFFEDCSLRAFQRGFAILQITIGKKRNWMLELRLEDLKQA